MAKIIWSNLAMEDLRNIYEFISKNSVRYADSLVERIIERVDILETHPFIGRKVPEIANDSIRELIEGNYRIIYRLESEKRVAIVRVHHGAKPLKKV